MALIAVVTLAILSLAALAVLTVRSVQRAYLAPAWLGWTGSWLVLGAFVALPWAAPGAPDAFTRNAAWLADHVVYLEWLVDLPVVQDKIGAMRLDTVDEIRQMLDRPDASQFLVHIEKGFSLSGWQLLRMAWPAGPWLPLATGAGLAAALLALAATLLALSPAAGMAGKLGLGAGILAALSLLVLLSKLPFIDTLGVTDNLAIRLIAVLGEVRVTAGGWWMALGLFILICAALLYLTLARSSSAPDQSETPWDAAADFT
jgi:hypothetical protein